MVYEMWILWTLVMFGLIKVVMGPSAESTSWEISKNSFEFLGSMKMIRMRNVLVEGVFIAEDI